MCAARKNACFQSTPDLSTSGQSEQMMHAWKAIDTEKISEQWKVHESFVFFGLQSSVFFVSLDGFFGEPWLFVCNFLFVLVLFDDFRIEAV